VKVKTSVMLCLKYKSLYLFGRFEISCLNNCLCFQPRDGEPAIRVFTNEQIEIRENYYSQPLGRTDLLKAPDHYPPAEYRYTLKELTVVWYMYDGRDFGSSPKTSGTLTPSLKSKF